MHVALVEKMDEINKITNESDFNVESYFSQNKKYGVIASSSAYNYAYDVIRYNNLDIDVLKLGFSYPFPYDKVADFVKDYDEVFIVEEVDPIIEKDTIGSYW